MKFMRYFILILLPLFLFGCGCASEKVEIKPNETAFLVPMYGKTKEDQKKLLSIDFLNENKVSSKLIIIPAERVDMGGFCNYACMPTMRVITVDRTPVTREWTVDAKTGTSVNNQAIPVESLESIGFYIGCTVTAMIKEEDAAKFLYFYASSPLSAIVDNNIRAYFLSRLAEEFGSLSLANCREKKTELFRKITSDAKAEFLKFGITITNAGMVDGLTYLNKEIQASIDGVFKAQQKVIEEEQNTLAQAKINERELAKAQTNLETAQKFKQAQDAQIAKTTLEIEKTKADAMLEMAKHWKGEQWPAILPQGSSLMMGFDMPSQQKK